MANEFTTAEKMEALAGTLAIDLRADDNSDLLALYEEAIAYAGGEVDFYCQDKYLAADLAVSQWVQNIATAFALEWFCQRRLNSVPESLAAMCDRYRLKLDLVLEGKAHIPGVPRSRRAVVISNQTVDLQRFNNQVRTDKARSTGVVEGYRQRTDPTAVDGG
jgi:hypothetical protein